MTLLIDLLATARLARAWVKDSEDFPPLKPVHAAAERALAGHGDWEQLAQCPWCSSFWLGFAVVAVRRFGGRLGAAVLFALAGSHVAGLLADWETEREEMANVARRTKVTIAKQSRGDV